MLFYFTVTTSRTGASYFHELLISWGKFGYPQEWIREYVDNNGLSYAEAVDLVYDKTNTDGVAGDKVLPRLLGGYLDNPSSRPYEYKYIFWQRRDTLAQAVSLYRAETSKLWHIRERTSKKNPPVPFNRERILELQNTIHVRMAVGEEIFSKHNIQPLRLYYEDLLQDEEDTLRQATKYLGIDPPPGVKATSTLRITRDELSEYWVRKIRGNYAAIS